MHLLHWLCSINQQGHSSARTFALEHKIHANPKAVRFCAALIHVSDLVGANRNPSCFNSSETPFEGESRLHVDDLPRNARISSKLSVDAKRSTKEYMGAEKMNGSIPSGGTHQKSSCLLFVRSRIILRWKVMQHFLHVRRSNARESIALPLVEQ